VSAETCVVTGGHLLSGTILTAIFGRAVCSHDTAVVGSGSELEVVDLHEAMARKGRDYIRLDKGKAWVAREHTPSTHKFPTSAMFSDGNGGECERHLIAMPAHVTNLLIVLNYRPRRCSDRKSMHVYAPPFAQLVESPTHFAGSPMQIDSTFLEKIWISRIWPATCL
jgi:hypothetical protein